MAFQKLTAFSKTVSDLSDKPALTPTALKAQFDSSPNELKDSFNSLVDALKSTTAGDSGAKNTGATPISGLTGSDVQTLLESLKTNSYSKSEADGKYTQGAFKIQKGTVNGGTAGSVTVTFPTAFTATPAVLLSLVSFSGVHSRYYVYGPSSTGFQIFHDTTDLSTKYFTWVAIGV